MPGAVVAQTLPDGTVLEYEGDVLVRQRDPDGTVYSAFDEQKRPGHVETPAAGDRPATSADIAYEGDLTIYTYPDSVVTYQGSQIVSQRLPDGTVYSDYTGDRAGRMQTADGTIEIDYVGDKTLYSYPDGSVITYQGEQIVSQRLANGTEYSDFTGDRAGFVSMSAQNGQPATTATIEYDGTNSVYTFADHRVVTYNAAGDVVGERLPDGTVYSGFDDLDRPTNVAIPAQNGQDAVSAVITYDNGYTRYTYHDKTELTFQGPNNDLISQKLPDGSIYTRFDESDRPQHVEVPAYGGKPSSSADISYDGDRTTYTYADGTEIVYNQVTGTVISQTAADGRVFSDFDDAEQPGHVEIPPANGKPATSADITYDGELITYTYADGSVVVHNSTTERVVTQTTPEGVVYSDFDAAGNPGHVKSPATADRPATEADISYPEGLTVYTYKDGTVVTYTSGSNQLLTQKMADGTEYSAFNANGDPEHVTIPGQNGKPATSATIAYDGDRTVYTFEDGTKVHYQGETVVKQEMPDGWVITYQNGKPVSGVNNETGETMTVEPVPGGSLWTYSDGTKVWQNDKGEPIKMTNAEGWTFTEFNGDGQPTRGTRTDPVTGETTTMAIDYDIDGKGSTRWVYTTGDETTTIITDGNGAPFSQTNPDGTTFEFMVELPKLLTAIGTVSTQRDLINHTIDLISQRFTDIHTEMWTGPASDAYDDHMQSIRHLKASVAQVLSESIQRMQIAYNNYVEAERVSHDNLTLIPVEKSPAMMHAATRVGTRVGTVVDQPPLNL
ncbi:MAG TPA: hypothetical protein VN408_14555 [Actinoplanes sp.]|nr:hypothetical protein [Actinoplanes sp.]